jgi:hypothetical protein
MYATMPLVLASWPKSGGVMSMKVMRKRLGEQIGDSGFDEESDVKKVASSL